MNREDVIRITESVLEGLTLGVGGSDFTNPNVRVIELWYMGKVISSIEIDITDRPEYEG